MTSIETLRAMLHPTRRRIVQHLHVHGPGQVGTLARDLDQQVGSISHHLRVLARAGVVEQAPELATDGRTSWWRVLTKSVAWSPDDFVDSPADHMWAKAAEKLNVEHQFARWTGWKRRERSSSQAWRRSAFSTDFVAAATPEELRELSEALVRTCQEWRAGIATDDGQEREPVFVFAHGFPSRP